MCVSVGSKLINLGLQLGVFSGEDGSKRITTYPVQVPVLTYSSACKTMFVPVLSYIGRTYDIATDVPRLSSGV